MMRKTLTAAVLFALALGACNSEKKAKPAEPKTTDETMPAVPAAKPAEPAAKPEEAAKPAQPEGQKMADLRDLQPNAVPAQSLQALDGVSQFSLGDDKQGCSQYGHDVSDFFNSFATEFKTLEESFSPDAAGVAAMRKFSGFLKDGATKLKGIKVEGDNLAAGHAEFVGTIEELAGGFDELATGIEAQDQTKTQTAAQRVQTGVEGFKSSLNKLVAICGE
jgi:hypothetical protein